MDAWYQVVFLSCLFLGVLTQGEIYELAWVVGYGWRNATGVLFFPVACGMHIISHLVMCLGLSSGAYGWFF